MLELNFPLAMLVSTIEIICALGLHYGLRWGCSKIRLKGDAFEDILLAMKDIFIIVVFAILLFEQIRNLV